MLYGSQTRIAHFLTNLAQGFQQTRLDILLFFLIVVALLLAFFLYFVAQKRRAHRELARRSREMLVHFLGKLDLNDGEARLLGRLTLYLGRGESEHDLLVNAHVFDACARKMLQSEDVSNAHIDALRLKIGFRITQPEGAPASSSALPRGSPVLLVAGAGTRLRGTIIEQRPEALLVRLGPGAPPVKDARLTLYFHNSAGVFSFRTRIMGRREDAVQLAHSTQITKHQRRMYYRRKIRLPVFVRSSSGAGVPQESVLLDLGGGGAGFQNPGGLFKKGDLIEISFSPEAGKFTLVGRVLRVSKNGSVVNVKFEFLPEAERNRILGFLSGQSERQKTRSR